MNTSAASGGHRDPPLVKTELDVLSLLPSPRPLKTRPIDLETRGQRRQDCPPTFNTSCAGPSSRAPSWALSRKREGRTRPFLCGWKTCTAESPNTTLELPLAMGGCCAAGEGQRTCAACYRAEAGPNMMYYICSIIILSYSREEPKRWQDWAKTDRSVRYPGLAPPTSLDSWDSRSLLLSCHDFEHFLNTLASTILHINTRLLPLQHHSASPSPAPPPARRATNPQFKQQLAFLLQGCTSSQHLKSSQWPWPNLRPLPSNHPTSLRCFGRSSSSPLVEHCARTRGSRSVSSSLKVTSSSSTVDWPTG